MKLPIVAAGSAGIEAVTNIVVRQAQTRMLVLLYAAVVLLCLGFNCAEGIMELKNPIA